MKKFTKILVCTAFAAVLGSGLAFAKGNDHMGKGNGGKFTLNADGTVAKKIDLIGQVTAVDEKNNTITVANVDGKESVIVISPFTFIRTDDSKDEKAISDIKKGDWVQVALYNTETEKLLASRILLKK